MGSDWGEFWRRILRFSWFGHQSLFDLIPTFVVPCTTGHLPAFSSVFASMFPSDRVPVFFDCSYGPFRSKRVERLLEAAGMRLPGFGERLEPVGDLVEAFLAGGAGHARIHVGVFVGLAGDRGLLGEIEIAAVRQALAGKRVLQILLGLGSLERRHVPSSAWSEKPMMARTMRPPEPGVNTV